MYMPTANNMCFVIKTNKYGILRSVSVRKPQDFCRLKESQRWAEKYPLQQRTNSSFTPIGFITLFSHSFLTFNSEIFLKYFYSLRNFGCCIKLDIGTSKRLLIWFYVISSDACLTDSHTILHISRITDFTN